MGRSPLLVEMLLKTSAMRSVALWSTSGMKNLTGERWGKTLSLSSGLLISRPVVTLLNLSPVFRMNEQVKKMKSYKREKWRSGNIFQKIQDRRSKWSVTPGGKRVFGVRRWESRLLLRSCRLEIKTILYTKPLYLFSFKKKKISYVFCKI